MKNQVLLSGGMFKLVKKKRDHKKWYVVECATWDLIRSKGNFDVMDEVRDFFDPYRNKSGKNGTAWKFSNRKDAEQMYMTAILRWA